MVSNYGVILRQIRDGKGVFCYTAFFLASLKLARQLYVLNDSRNLVWMDEASFVQV